MVLALGCGDKAPERATREDCAKVAEHIADLIVADAKANPDSMWDALHQGSGDTGIPAAVTKEQFKPWLGTSQGETWMMQRRGQTLAGTQQGIEPCVQKGSKPLVQCLLAANTKEAVEACDKRFAPAAPGSAAAGSATGSASH
jgi:hypothetical protein